MLRAARLLLVATSVAASLPAAAGTQLHYEIVGYSPDRRYLAILRSGMEDGSGESFCDAGIIDVRTASWAEGPRSVRLEPEPGPGRDPCQRALAKIRKALVARGISEADKGKTLLRQQPPATGRDGSIQPAPDISRVSIEDPCQQRKCTLRLVRKEQEPQDVSGRTFLQFQLELRCGERKTVLACPSDRGQRVCSALEVGIDRIQVAGEHLVVFLEVASPGFEGPDRTPMVATGPFPDAGGAGSAESCPTATALEPPKEAPLKPTGKEAFTPIGFSASGDAAFGYLLSRMDAAAGEAVADLRVIRAADGKELLKDVSRAPHALPAEAAAGLRARREQDLRGLGLSPSPEAGQELYSSGTATHTAFDAGDLGRFELDLRAKKGSSGTDQALEVVLTRAGKPRTIHSSSGGYAYSINSVLFSPSRRALAVVIKHSRLDDQGEHREHEVVVVALQP
jgi:predicted secreted protein